MNRSLLRGLAGIAALVLALTGVACSPKAGSDRPDNIIRIFSPQNPDENLEENSFTKEIEAKFGVDLQFETTTFDVTSATEKRQISLASGDLPDAYLLVPWVNQFSQAELRKLGEQDVIVALNDLIESDAPNLKSAWQETPEFKKMATAPDGKVWGLPQWNDCFHCSFSQKLWMNSAWLKKLGLQQPTTPEELRTVLQAFKTKDPNGNGKADEIPLSASVANPLLPYLMNPFVYVPTSDPSGAQPGSLALQNDQVVLQPTQDGWREGLRYVRSLWRDGLIDKAAFSQNADALSAKGNNAGTVLVGAATIQHPAILTKLGQKDGRDKDYDAVAPLEGSNGDPASYVSPSVAGATFVITSAASEAKRKKLVQIVDYLVETKGHLRAEFGVEGVNWKQPSGTDKSLDPAVPPLFATIAGDPDAPVGPGTAWASRAQYYSSAAFRGGQVVPTDIYSPVGYERRLFQATEKYADKQPSATIFPYWNVWIGDDVAADVATAQTNVESLVSRASAEFITGTRNIDDDGDWRKFQSELEANGSGTYVKSYQDAWTASR